MAAATGHPKILAFIGHNDADILPFFLEHYRGLGVSGFKLALHGPWPEPVLDGLTALEDVAIWDLLGDVYEDSYRRSVLNLMAEDEIGRWVVVVDADEFLELPLGSLSRTIAALEVMGETALPAFLLQRVSEDGGLPALDPGLPIEQQMPLGHFGLCEAMQTERPVWKTKYPLAKVEPGFKVQRGHHWPPVKGAQAHLPIRGVLHHYKWRSALLSAFDLSRGPSSNSDEMASYRHWLETHAGRLPVAGARPAEREDLFARGLMVKPSRRQLLQGALQRELRSGGRKDRGRHARLTSQLDHIVKEPDSESLTSARHLLLPPGRICLVTFDLTPPLTSGGIGTAMAALAEHLSAAGHEVHLLYCPYDGPADLWPLWYDYWDNRGVTLHYLPRVAGEDRQYLGQGRFLSRITDFLQNRQFDVVHVADAAGYGQAYAICRAAGLVSSRTRLVVTAHGGIAWHRRGNHLPWTRDEADATFAEHQMLTLADIVCCPSRYMRDLLVRAGALSPERALVLPNCLSNLSRSYSDAKTTARAVNEFVMLGRIERRKGLVRFAEAIRRLQSKGRFEFEVTFLGTPGPGIEIDDVRAMLGGKGETARFIDDFGPLQAINYLRTRDCMVVVPSLEENLPYAVYEALENGVPILTSDAGGIPELIDEGDRARVQVAADPEKLADAMAEALIKGGRPGRLASDPGEVALKHLALHAKLVDQAKRLERGRDQAAAVSEEVSVAAVLYGRGVLAEKLEARRNEVLPRERHDLRTAARAPDHHAVGLNAVIQDLGAEWLLLCHVLAVPEPGALPAMRGLLSKSGVDAVVTGYRVARLGGGAAGPDDGLLAPGGPAVFSPSWNLFGIGVTLISRKRFIALGGFRADAVDDRFFHWGLLNRLLAEEGEVIGIPKPLVTGYCKEAGDLSSGLTSGLAEALLAPWLEKATPDLQAFLRKSAAESFGQCPEMQRAEEWLRSVQDTRSSQ